MASGDPVVAILERMPPGNAFAFPDTRPGGSSPAESVSVLDFPADATVLMDYLCHLRGYGGGGLTLQLAWMAELATSGGVRWEAAIRRWQDGVSNLGAAHTYVYQGVTSTAPATAGIVRYASIALGAGQIDGWADDEQAIVRLRRVHDHAGDTMTNDAELLGWTGSET